MSTVKTFYFNCWWFWNRNGTSPTTYALLGHSSSYYSGPPGPTGPPGPHQVSSVSSLPSSHTVYQSIVYPHSHQYHTIHHTETRHHAPLYAQTPHYRLAPPGGDHLLETLHTGVTGVTSADLHGLTHSPISSASNGNTQQQPPTDVSVGSVSPEQQQQQQSTDPAVWRPYWTFPP